MRKIDVAVVIVTYRSARLTVECLRSIEVERRGHDIPIRVVVVDNASGDCSTIRRAIDENGWSSWVALITAPRNGGFAYGNNLGFQHAYRAGLPSYLHMLNPDTVVRPGAISSLVQFLESNKEVGIAGSSFENSDGSEWEIAFRFPSLLSELAAGLQLGLATRLLEPWVVAKRMTPFAQRIDWVSGASMMIRREVVDVIGGLDEGYFLYFEETDFCYRARRAGFPTWYVPESRVMHIAGQSTKVTERNAAPKRLPPYWFESRRRFFASCYGLHYAIAVDVIALMAHAVGSLKRCIQGRGHQGIPFFLRDLACHSALWPSSRSAPQIKRFVPGA